jgi:hypothetical protein
VIAAISLPSGFPLLLLLAALVLVLGEHLTGRGPLRVLGRSGSAVHIGVDRPELVAAALAVEGGEAPDPHRSPSRSSVPPLTGG